MLKIHELKNKKKRLGGGTHPWTWSTLIWKTIIWKKKKQRLYGRCWIWKRWFEPVETPVIQSFLWPNNFSIFYFFSPPPGWFKRFSCHHFLVPSLPLQTVIFLPFSACALLTVGSLSGGVWGVKVPTVSSRYSLLFWVMTGWTFYSPFLIIRSPSAVPAVSGSEMFRDAQNQWNLGNLWFKGTQSRRQMPLACFYWIRIN